jgi:Tol biopolymer transport system component/formylglycine-generating enzyme required for sulfatase activity
MTGLPGELYKRCRDTLLRCSEFDSNAALRAVFVTEEIAPFRGGLPEAASKSERVDACLDYLLQKRLSDGRPVLPLFIEALRARYQPGDSLRDESEVLAEVIRQALASPDLPSIEQPTESVSAKPPPDSTTPGLSPSPPSSGSWFAIVFVIVVIIAALLLTGSITLPPSPGPAVTASATRDNSTMVYVPAGHFWMGSEDSDSDAPYDNEKPRHQVYLDAFWIHRTEVTNKQYKRCVDTEMCAPPDFPEDPGSAIPAAYYSDKTYDDYPVVYVGWHQAQIYCEWAGGRLPTEAEWEYAARGPEGRAFPWGNEFDGTRLNYCDANCLVDWAGPSWTDKAVNDGYALTAPVGNYPLGESWCGALDMAGNVWEWVADWYYPDYFSDTLATNPQGPASGRFRVIRGGGFDFDWQHVRSATRIEFRPSSTDDSTGFRCVHSAEVPAATSTPLPVPTLAPTPITATMVLSRSAVILSPCDGEQVSIRNAVRGQASNLWAGHQLWLLVQASEGRYYPQPGPIEVDSEGAWVASADIGSASQLEWERPYTVTMVMANQEASQKFSSFLNAWPVGQDKGLTLPEGCTVLDTAMVFRANPFVALTSHESQAYVGSHETLKGTYRNMKPGDWLLYGVVELGDERFIPYGPYEPRADSGEWAIDVVFPWPADGSRDVFFHTLAVLTYTHADEILRSSVGRSLSTADLSANDWNVIFGPVIQMKFTRAERIAFASDRPGNDDIFIIKVDGTGRLRLTDDPADDMDPAWSPDGTSVVFASTRDGPVQLFLVDSDGQNVRRLIPSRVVPGRAPNWSPDGEWIAFHSGQGRTTDIYKVRIAGTDLTRLTDALETDWYPVWSPDGEKILFYSERAEDDAGLGELYAMDADGQEESLTRLTENTFHESYAAWSPDGGRILFIREAIGKRAVYLMNADGSDAALVADIDYDRHPTFSPDGQRFVFNSSANNGQLFLATLGGGKPEQIQTGLTRSWWPSWSPVQDDERIVFEGRFDGDREIYSMWDDGTDQLRLMDNNSNEVQPRVSPDGRWVAFVSDFTGNYDIWLEDPRTPSEWRQLTNDPADDLRPAWSPDCKQIAFASNRDGDWDIYVMNDNGTGVVQLTDDPAEDSFPVWSPDGRRIAFYSERSGDGDIYMMDADGKNVTPLVENPGFDWSPAWSPDGQTVLFASARDHGGTYATEIYWLDISSRELKRLTDNDGYDGIPIWSSHGQRIFLTSDRDGGIDDIWVIDGDGGNARNLTEDDRSDIFGGP